jgi:hypothetical protein
MHNATASLWGIDRIVVIPLATDYWQYSFAAERCVAEHHILQPPGVVVFLILTLPICYLLRSV